MTDEASATVDVFDRASNIIRAGTVAGLATDGKNGPDLCAVFYVVMEGGRLGFKSRRSSTHMRNLATRPQAAALVYAHTSTYSAKFGVQLKGVVRGTRNLDEMAELVELYVDQFQGAGKKLGSIETLADPTTESTFFVFEIAEFRLVDESPQGNFTMLDFEPFASKL
ncbi:MAG TPA: hypothetical protein VGS08_02250 [Candidatus Saccharimonadales bacterium]|nr:hypothetical protein [Candidatus Saccharimonadales bacterium]